MRFLFFKDENRESGMALILAIGFLAVLSILGAVVMRVTTQDLSLSGAVGPEKEVFYAVDRAIEYSMTRGLILNMPINGQVNLMMDHVDPSDNTTPLHKDVIGTNKTALTSGMVYDVGPNDMPSSMSQLFGTDFGANYYHVEAKVQTPVTGTPRATTNANASIVRLFKMDDDTIFRTSRGG